MSTGTARNFAEAPESMHFPIGTKGAPTIVAPGVASPAGLSYFGRLNIATPRRLQHAHLHVELDGAAPGALVLELWRRRSGAMTQLVTMTYTAPAGSDYVTIAGVPATDELATLLRGDYLMCQAVTGTNLAGGWDGLTIDCHFLY